MPLVAVEIELTDEERGALEAIVASLRSEQRMVTRRVWCSRRRTGCRTGGSLGRWVCPSGRSGCGATGSASIAWTD